jgi:hypothetical protein
VFKVIKDAELPRGVPRRRRRRRRRKFDQHAKSSVECFLVYLSIFVVCSRSSRFSMALFLYAEVVLVYYKHVV